MNLNRIILTPVFPFWLVLLLLFLGLAAVILQYWLIRKRLGHKRAGAISILRLFVLSLLILFALNPSRIEKREDRVSPSIAVLIEASQSMNEAGSGGKSRLDEAKNLLVDGQKSLLKTLAEKYDVQLYSLSESLRSLDAKETNRS